MSVGGKIHCEGVSRVFHQLLCPCFTAPKDADQQHKKTMTNPYPPLYIAHPLLRAHDWQNRSEYARLPEWWRAGTDGVCALAGLFLPVWDRRPRRSLHQ